MFALGPISFSEKTFGINRRDVDIQKAQDAKFFLNHFIYISQPSFIKNKNNIYKGRQAHSTTSDKTPRSSSRSAYELFLCSSRPFRCFGSGIVLMG